MAAPPGGGTSLPVGFQLAGPAFSEGPMLEIAYALEQALGFDGSRARG
jgi:aspartyl-tRNA(Asn)/glutamyl-tRNA(Gln) amidotransferase subunit A